MHVESEAEIAALLIAMLVAGAAASGAVGSFAIDRGRPLEAICAVGWILAWLFDARDLVWLAEWMLGLGPGAAPASELGPRAMGIAAISGGLLTWSALRRVPPRRSSIAWLVIYGLVATFWMVAAVLLDAVELSGNYYPEELDELRMLAGIGYAGARVSLAVLVSRSVGEPIPRARIHAG